MCLCQVSSTFSRHHARVQEVIKKYLCVYLPMRGIIIEGRIEVAERGGGQLQHGGKIFLQLVKSLCRPLNFKGLLTVLCSIFFFSLSCAVPVPMQL